MAQRKEWVSRDCICSDKQGQSKPGLNAKPRYYKERIQVMQWKEIFIKLTRTVLRETQPVAVAIEGKN